jgi:anti-sigma factor RsiW
MTDEPLPSADHSLILQAALDGELDVAGTLAFEQRLAEDPILAAEYKRLVALRHAIGKLPKMQASDDFRARMTAIGTSIQKPSKQGVSKIHAANAWLRAWRPMAMAASVALVLGSGLTYVAMPPQGSDVMQDLIAGHVRGMISGQPADVATSDKHTVKPWFATRVVQAPQVVDLSAAGFTLDGGRIDVIDGKPVATLVFHHLKHVISVTELPGPRARFGTAATHRSVMGYSVLTWTMGDTPENKTTYVAISDIAPDELNALAAAFQQAVAADK